MISRIVFVQMPDSVVGVVQIAQHSRVMQCCGEQIAEATHGVRSDCTSLVIADQDADVRLVLMHVEMIEPEPHHPFAQLIRRV
jgi:hypothetical protein